MDKQVEEKMKFIPCMVWWEARFPNPGWYHNTLYRYQPDMSK